MKYFINLTIFILLAFVHGNCAQPPRPNSDTLFSKRRETLLKFCEIINTNVRDTIALKQVVITSQSNVDSLRQLGWALLFEQLEGIQKLGRIDTGKVVMENYQTTVDKERFVAFYSEPDILKDTYWVTLPTGVSKYFLFKGSQIYSFQVLKMGKRYIFLGY